MSAKDLPSPDAPNFGNRVREEIHRLLGKFGSSDRALTLRDAIDAGVIVPGPGGGLIPGPGVGGGGSVYVPDLTPPPTPTGFAVPLPGITNFFVEHDAPVYTQGNGHLRTRVFGATRAAGSPAPVFADAVEIDQFSGTFRAIPSNPSTTWHLWIKWETRDLVQSANPAGGTNGLVAVTGQDVSLLLTALADQIGSGQLSQSLRTPIDAIPGIGQTASSALAQANANLAAIGTIQTQLATLSGAPDYDAGTTYELDYIVKYSGGLYRALGTTTGNLPTNTAYWEKIGDYASLGDAVAAHAVILSDHETRVDSVEGGLASVAGRASVLEAAASSLADGLASKASVAYVDQAEADAVSAASTAVSTLRSEVAGIGGENLYAGFRDPLVAGPGAYGDNVYLKDGATNPMGLKPGDKLTISADLSQDAASASDGAGRQSMLFLWFATSAGTWIGSVQIATASTAAVRQSATVTLPASATDMHAIGVGVYHIGGNNSYLGTVRAERIQVEFGTVATPYKVGLRSLSAALQIEASTRATQTGELYAQYTVKTDVGGLISGYGLASTSANAAPTSAFGVQAGQFFVAPPTVNQAAAPTENLYKGFVWRNSTTGLVQYWAGSAWSTTPQSLPFVIQTTPQVINGFTVAPGIYGEAAFFARLVAARGQIGILAVDDARIASVAVGKLVAGSIAVGEYIQSFDYTAGSQGWRIWHNGAEFNQVVVRGTIFASQGAIGGWNIGATYLQSTTYVLGASGTRLNSDGTGQIGGVRITANTVESHTFESTSEPFGFRLRNDGASEFKGAVIRSGTGRVLLTAVGDAIPPWVTTLVQADDTGISLVADPDPDTNTAKLKSLVAGYGIDLESTDDTIAISAVPPSICVRVNQTQNSATWADVQGVSWPLDADSQYEFDGFFRVSAAISDTKTWQVALLLPSGSDGSGSHVFSGSESAGMRSVDAVDGGSRLIFGVLQGFLSGSQVYGHTQMIRGYFSTASSGVAKLQFRRLSGTAANVLQQGSFLKIRKTTLAPQQGALASPQAIPETAASSVTAAVLAVPGIKFEISSTGSWFITRNGSSQLTGYWMQGAPLLAGEAQNYDVKIDVTPRVLGGSGPNAYVKANFTASNWVQVSSKKTADVWMDTSSGGTGVAGTRTCSFTMTITVRDRVTQVQTVLGTIACTLSGTVTSSGI